MCVGGGGGGGWGGGGVVVVGGEVEGGAYAASQTTVLHLNQTESPIFVILCVLCFQRQSFLTFIFITFVTLHSMYPICSFACHFTHNTGKCATIIHI